jgi:Phytanoyl-CoA dioxygenase (PhyH)
MANQTGVRDTRSEHGSESFVLAKSQVAYFKTFGFLKIPALFAPEIDRIREGFEEVFANEPSQLLDPRNPYHRARDPQYEEQTREIIPAFIDRSPKLSWLRDDPRTVAVAKALLGDGFVYAESDGNLFNCDVYWHLDVYGAVDGVEHIKLSFYLDELHHDTGALRVIPGSHFESTYAKELYRGIAHEPGRVRDNLGISVEEIPSWTLEVTPGDLIVGNFRTMHGSFNGAVRRRLFTVNFSAAHGGATGA